MPRNANKSNEALFDIRLFRRVVIASVNQCLAFILVSAIECTPPVTQGRRIGSDHSQPAPLTRERSADGRDWLGERTTAPRLDAQ
jgi:hypothetical protein